MDKDELEEITLETEGEKEIAGKSFNSYYNMGSF